MDQVLDDSFNKNQPDSYPEHLEAGTLNIPGIASLNAGMTQFAQLYDNHAFESSVINALSVLLCIITMPIINIIYTFLL